MDRLPLAGSTRALQDLMEDPDPLERVRVTLHLAGARSWGAAELMAQGALPPGQRSLLPPKEAVPAEAMAALRAFAAEHGLDVVAEEAALHRMDLEGPAEAVAAAFGVQWSQTPTGHRVAHGTLSLPAALAPLVRGVVGLDARPRMRPHLHRPDAAVGDGSGFEVPALADFYSFPPGTGRGIKVGLIELGGGFKASDMEAFFASHSLPVPSIRIVSVGGAVNDPETSDVPARMEVTLDLQVLGGLVPEAEFAVYMAPNTDQGFLDAMQAAAQDPAGRPSILSISWGSAELRWSFMEALLLSDAFMEASGAGMTILASAGDYGSREEGADKPAVVNFPASSPWALSCGGTTLSETGEQVWNSSPSPGATGGGVSDLFDLPDYQKAEPPILSVTDGKSRRVVPDLAALADGATGYRVFVDGQWRVLGGTSAAAPLWAALLARCEGALGTPCGFLHPFLYGNVKARAAFQPILVGNNGDYHAGPAFDACTGLGTPHGRALLEALKGS